MEEQIENIEIQKPRIATARSVAKRIVEDLKFVEAPVLLLKVVAYLTPTHALEVHSFDFQDIDGIQMLMDGKNFIGLNNELHPNRRRFTLAHEIGHLLLGHTRFDYTPVDFGSGRPEEIEANQFAAELLMPLSFLKSDILKGGIKNAQDLSRRYMVSEEAMWWRLNAAGLLKRL